MLKYTQLKNATKEQLRSLPDFERAPLIAEQIKRQVAAHQHKNYETNIKLTDGAVLKDFAVHKNVMRPEIMSSLFLARYFYFNQDLYGGKCVLDMGCGSGILGTVMGMNGASRVVFSDIAAEAIENTKENVLKYGLKQKSEIIQSDLFEKIPDYFDVINANGANTRFCGFDLIVFNHPFFSELSLKREKVDDTMIQPASLLERFFRDAYHRMDRHGSKMLMSYLHLAGQANDPEIQAPKCDRRAREVFSMNLKTGLQNGAYSIYELKI